MTKNKGGRPRIINSPEAFEAAVTAYFEKCEHEERPPTMAGMALFMGFADRQSFYDYEKLPEYATATRRARARVEQHHEERMSGNTPTGSIFWLKNHGWSDRHEVSGPEGGPVYHEVVVKHEIVDAANPDDQP